MLVATGYKVLVKPDKAETTTKSGIVHTLDEKLEQTGVQRGVVISIGPIAWQAFRGINDKGQESNGRAWALPGDYVVFARFAGKTIIDDFDTADNKEYLIMNDEDIIAVQLDGDNPNYDNVTQQKLKNT